MADAVAAPAAAPAAVNVPIVAPPADQPPTGKPKSYGDRWAEMEAKLGTTEANAEETATAGGEPEKPKTEAEGEPKPKNGEPTAGDKGMFEALAKKLGYSLDGKTVLPSDRIAWETAKKRQEAGLAERENKLREAEQAISSSDRVKKAESILKSIEEGDPDGFAAAIGKKDFNEFQQEFIKRLADPNYSELQNLKKWREEQEKSVAEQKKQQEQTQRQQEHQRQLQAYLGNLSEQSKTSTDPTVAAMADDPLFVDAVYRIQQQEYKASGERIIPIEEALDKRIGGAKMTFREELKTLAQRLLKAFPDLGAPAAPAAAPPAPVSNGKRPAPRTAITPPNTVDSAGAPKRIGEMTPSEYREYKRQRYAEAETAERKALGRG